MPYRLAWLCLVLALTAQPLRQAEAADDCGRALADLLQKTGTIHVIDGGVGDDAVDATLHGAGADTLPSMSTVLVVSWERIDLGSLASSSDVVFPLLGLHPTARRTFHPIESASRLAWLQLFQI